LASQGNASVHFDFDLGLELGNSVFRVILLKPFNLTNWQQIKALVVTSISSALVWGMGWVFRLMWLNRFDITGRSV
jgi:hypothetical protein